METRGFETGPMHAWLLSVCLHAKVRSYDGCGDVMDVLSLL